MNDYSGLIAVMEGLRYDPAWEFRVMQGPSIATGRTRTMGDLAPVLTSSASVNHTCLVDDWRPVYLLIELHTADSGDPEHMVTITHLFACPHASYAGDWAKWVLECIFRVHMHEAMETFEVDGVKPFYPEHGSGSDPYRVSRKT